MAFPPLFPLYERNWWLYRTDQGSITIRVTGIDTIKNVPCFLVEVAIGNEVLQVECYEANNIGIWLHARRIASKEIECFPPYPILRLPLHMGSEWSWRGTMGDEEKYISFYLDKEELVGVPAGEFVAIRIKMVERSMHGSNTTYRWYTEKIGMIKESSEQPGVRYQAELVDFDLRGQ